jgi:hypothetical protein
MGEKWLWIDGSVTMRDELLDGLTDADLAFTPGGANMPLGELIREMGEVQQSYLTGVETLVQDFTYRNPDPGIEHSVERLRAWFHQLDAKLSEVASGFTDDDLNKKVVRAGGYEMPVEMSLDVYVQALLIFFGKAAVYLKAMNKPLPPLIADWIW